MVLLAVVAAGVPVDIWRVVSIAFFYRNLSTKLFEKPHLYHKNL
jgi:hypothetical protein